MKKEDLKAGAGATSPRCNECRYYYITHDIRFMYGCRALDFKSRRQPALDVLASSGQPCLYFRMKKKAGP